MKLSIIIPAYNEEKRIEPVLREYCKYFKRKYKKDFEIIVVLNGCVDNTLGVVKKIKKDCSQVRYLEFKQSGKGFAVIEGFKAAKGKLIGFSDADGSTSPEKFDDLVINIGNADGIIANRWMKGSIVEPKQPLKRIFASRMFNLLVRVLFGIRLSDTQCGAKLFKREAIGKIIKYMGITEWAFDIDLLYHLKRRGYKVKQIPTVWRDKKGSKLNVGKTSTRMFFSVIRLRLVYSPLRIVVKAYDLLPEFMKIHHRLTE